MIKKLLIASVISATALSMQTTAFAQAPATQPVAAAKIAIINLPLILSKIPQAKTSRDALQKEFAPREQEVVRIDQQAQTLAKELQDGKYSGDAYTQAMRKLAQIQSDLKLKAQALREDQTKRVEQEQIKLGTLVQKQIDSIVKERGIDVVLRGDMIASYVNPQYDISQEIIDRVSKAK